MYLEFGVLVQSGGIGYIGCTCSMTVAVSVGISISVTGIPAIIHELNPRAEAIALAT